jgi:hypothetical protein
MSNMPGNVNNLSHEEAIGTHIKPETQTRGFREFPKQVGLTKPTEAEAKAAKESGVPFVGKPVVARNAEEATEYSSTGFIAPLGGRKPLPTRDNDDTLSAAEKGAFRQQPEIGLYSDGSTATGVQVPSEASQQRGTLSRTGGPKPFGEPTHESSLVSPAPTPAGNYQHDDPDYRKGRSDVFTDAKNSI